MVAFRRLWVNTGARRHATIEVHAPFYFSGVPCFWRLRHGLLNPKKTVSEKKITCTA